jgi:hypothetical protein
MDTPRVHSGPWDQLGTGHVVAGGGNDIVSVCEIKDWRVGRLATMRNRKFSWP